MNNSIGKMCPYCKTEIKEGEIIKICPSCGMPHHIECWEENEGCTTFGCTGYTYETRTTNLSGSCPNCGAPFGDGFAFCAQCGTPKPQPEPSSITTACSHCGAPLTEGQAFCSHCGTPRTAPVAPPTQCNHCGAPLTEGQAFCGQCGNQVASMMSPNVASAIDQFNANIQMKKSNKKNVCMILAIIFAAIGVIPILNYIFLPPAIVLFIIGLCTGKNSKKGILIAGVIVVALSLIVSVCWMLPEAISEEDFNDMYSDIEGQYWCEIATDGSWMEIDTNPYDVDDYTNSTALSKIKTINSELGFPSYVYQDMLETRSIDGRQSTTSGRYTVTWTYHPDEGLEVMYKIND